MEKKEIKRISYKPARPNPLFQYWLEELREEAKINKSKLEPMLKVALESLSKYPLPLQSGAECAVLKGFKKKLCIFLDRRLEVHRSNTHHREVITASSSNTNPTNNNTLRRLKKSGVFEFESNNRGCNLEINELSHISSESFKGNPNTNFQYHVTNDSNPEHPPKKKPKEARTGYSSSSTNCQKICSTIKHSTSDSHSSCGAKKKELKTYKPVYQSGGYAILLALLEHVKAEPENVSLTKEQLIEKAQKYCEESFVRPKPESFYTAWSSMSTLVSKGLVTKTRRKKVEYSLTDLGQRLAEELHEETAGRKTVNDIIFDNAMEAVEVDSNYGRSFELQTDNTLIVMHAGSFDVILLIDKNETGGVTKKNDPTVAQFNKYPDLKHEYRSLKVGDFTWIARHKVHKDQELVLPYVVERKRMDDLAASIKDGRFHEQKFRLRKCGIENVIYMIENYGSNKRVGLPIQSLKQALENTRVQDGFRIHVTDSLTNSARFLAMMTKRLTIEFKDKILTGVNCEPNGEVLMTFNYFNKSSAKTKCLTVTETFIKMLLQLKGVSVEKALAITKKYNTPRCLIQEYKGCSEKEGELLLANLKHDDLSRNVGPNVSKAIYQLFSNFNPD